MKELVLAVALKIKPDCVDKFMAEALKNGKAARETEPGCKQFDIVVDPNDPTRAMLYEIYADEAAFEAHQQTPHFKHYLANALQYLESRERTFYRRAAP
ncbi:MAG TPA: putative quinol monooxygenase [Vicinamibacterales bacterium]|jgi:quinol monooxygenase YgiN|nr:putative quinol monooxygenase [Vicinamibacterales bacterium]